MSLYLNVEENSINILFSVLIKASLCILQANDNQNMIKYINEFFI